MPVGVDARAHDVPAGGARSTFIRQCQPSSLSSAGPKPEEGPSARAPRPRVCGPRAPPAPGPAARPASRRSHRRRAQRTAASQSPRRARALPVAERLGWPARGAAVSAAVRWMTAGLMNGAGAIGATTVPSSPLRGARPIGLIRRTAAATAASLIRIAGSVIEAESSDEATATRLWKVPPDMPSESRGMPAGRRRRHLEVDALKALRPALVGGLGRHQHEQVGGQRLEPAYLTIFTPASAAGPLRSSMTCRANVISPVRSR